MFYPLTPAQIAAGHYALRTEADEALRNARGYAALSIDDGYVQQIRDGIAQRLESTTLAELLGEQIALFQSQGKGA